MAASHSTGECPDSATPGGDFKIRAAKHHQPGESMPAPVVHFEIGCKDIEATRKFYSSQFGWEYMPGAPNMAMVGNLGPFAGTPTQGIGGHINCLGHPPHNYVTVYIQVEDIAKSLAGIEKAGG